MKLGYPGPFPEVHPLLAPDMRFVPGQGLMFDPDGRFLDRMLDSALSDPMSLPLRRAQEVAREQARQLQRWMENYRKAIHAHSSSKLGR